MRGSGKIHSQKQLPNPWQEIVCGIGLTSRVSYKEDALRKAQAPETDATQPKRDEMEIVETMISDTKDEAGRIARELSGYKESDRDRPSYRALRKQRDEVDERHAALLRKRAALQETIEQSALSDRQIETMLDYRHTTLIGLDNLTIADKHEMLPAL